MELTSITPTPQMLRALAHPTRLKMLGMLRIDGPATATTLATRLGINTGQTSYHLRQLAQHGFVVDDDERGNGRERWWKAAHQSTITGDMPERPEDQEALDAYMQTVAVMYTQQLQAAVEEMSLLPLRVARGVHAERLPRPGHGRARAGAHRRRCTSCSWSCARTRTTTPTRWTSSFQFQAFPRPGHVAGVEER